MQICRKFWSFCGKEVIECPNEKVFANPENQEIHQKFQHLSKANLILQADAQIPKQNIYSWLCTVSLQS